VDCRARCRTGGGWRQLRFERAERTGRRELRCVFIAAVVATLSTSICTLLLIYRCGYLVPHCSLPATLLLQALKPQQLSPVARISSCGTIIYCTDGERYHFAWSLFAYDVKPL